MKYITGIHALNIPCNLNTSGDWHRGTLDWGNPWIRESEDSIYRSWGIYEDDGRMVADHLRAVLDMLECQKDLVLLHSFHSDYISNYEYDEILNEQLSKLKTLAHWREMEELVKRNMHRRSLDIEELRRSGKLRKRRGTP